MSALNPVSKSTRLRAVTRKEVGLLVGWANDPGVPETWFSPLCIDQRTMLNLTSRTQDGSHPRILAITSNDRPVGYVSARAIYGNAPVTPPVFEVGVLVGVRSIRGRGVGSAAVSHLLDLLFHDGSCERVQAMIDPDNRPSIRLFERLGFIREGVLRAYTRRGRRMRDEALYAQLKADWLSP